ncbi:MAG: hypothetical protein RLZZ350_850, partial [Verrucomicrobiota bacterium]
LELSFNVYGLGTANSSKNLRFAVLDSSAGARATADNQTQSGANCYGYTFLQNFASTWGNASGLQIMERTNTSVADVLATTANSASIKSGGSASATEAFTNGGSYKLTLTLTHSAAAKMDLTMAYTGGGLTNTLTTNNVLVLQTNFDSFVIRPSSDNGTATNFVFTRFKVTGPAGAASAPLVVTQPQSLTREVGTHAPFSLAASGGQPLAYQWYLGGNALAGQTNTSLAFANVQLAQAGNYTCVVTNAQGAATSSVAVLTVTTPVYSANGLVMDDFWLDGDRTSGFIATNNSIWFSSTAADLTAAAGSMTGTPNASASRTWLGYFADTPVDLAVGQQVKATVVFTPTSPAATNTSSLRFGIFNYGDGASRVLADNFGNTNFNVNGYEITQNFGTNFGDDTPTELFVRTNLADGDLLGTSSDFLSLGAIQAGFSNAAAFASGTAYTLTFTVARTSTTNVSLTASVTGGALANVTVTKSDTNYLYRRFDAFAIRANRTTDSATAIAFSEFKVEVANAAVSPIPVAIAQANGNVILTWSNPTFSLQSSTNVVTNYTTIVGATSPYTIAPSGVKKFFRLFAP